MKIGDLLNILKNYDPEFEVYVFNNSGNWMFPVKSLEYSTNQKILVLDAEGMCEEDEVADEEDDEEEEDKPEPSVIQQAVKESIMSAASQSSVVDVCSWDREVGDVINTKYAEAMPEELVPA